MVIQTKILRAAEIAEELAYTFPNMVASVATLPTAPLVDVRAMSTQEALVFLAENNHGLLDVLHRGEKPRNVGLGGYKASENFALTLGAMICITEDDIQDQSGLRLLDGTNIVINRTRNEILSTTQGKAMKALRQRFVNTLTCISQQLLEGGISLKDKHGGTLSVPTRHTVIGNTPAKTWDDPTADVLADMAAMETVMRGDMSNNFMQGLEYGHTLMNTKVLRNLQNNTQLNQTFGMNTITLLHSPFGNNNLINPATDLNRTVQGISYPQNQRIYDAFGTVLYADPIYFDNNGSLTSALDTTKVYCVSGTAAAPPSPAFKVAITPSLDDDRYTPSGAFDGAGILVYEETSNDPEKDRWIQKIGIRTTLIINQLKHIYTMEGVL